MRNSRVWDLLLVAAWAIASLLLLQLAPFTPSWVKAALAVPWVLGLTGYAITAAIFPHQQVGKAVRLFFAITLSLAITALGGLILNLTRDGLRRDNWLMYLCGVTLAACLIALVRRLGDTQHAPSQARSPIQLSIGPKRMAQGALFVCAGLIAVVAIALARIPPAPNESLQSYTLLWILPPGTGKNTDTQNARVGVQSAEFAVTQYRLQVVQAGQIIQEWQLQLTPGESWESEGITIASRTNTTDKADSQVKALLYRVDVPSVVYRQVAYWPNKPASEQVLQQQTLNTVTTP